MAIKHAIAALSLAMLFLITAKAGAGENASPQGGDADTPFFGVSLGVKGAFGGNFVTDPDNAPPGAIIFDDGAGGIGGGGGLYTEFRILNGHLGLEFDLIFEKNKNWSSITFSNVVETDWIFTFNAVRIPLLLEGSVESESVRGSLGIGPEFVVGTGASTDIEVTEGDQYLDEDGRQGLEATADRFTASKQTDTYICFGLGLAIKVWKLAITIDMRYAYNLTQPSEYDDRVEYSGSQTEPDVETIASNSMDLRILLGVAYELGF